MDASIEVEIFYLAISVIPKLRNDSDYDNQDFWKSNVLFWLGYLNLSKYILEDVPVPAEGTTTREVYDMECLNIKAALWDSLEPDVQSLLTQHGWIPSRDRDPKALWDLIMTTVHRCDPAVDDLTRRISNTSI